MTTRDRPAEVQHRSPATVSLSFACDATVLADVRGFVADWFESQGAHRDTVELAELVSSELATNSIRHGGTPFIVACDLIEGASGEASLGRISVRDEAAGELPVLAEPDRRAVGGRGLSIVARVSAAWGVEITDDAKTVWCELVLP